MNLNGTQLSQTPQAVSKNPSTNVLRDSSSKNKSSNVASSKSKKALIFTDQGQVSKAMIFTDQGDISQMSKQKNIVDSNMVSAKSLKPLPLPFGVVSAAAINIDSGDTSPCVIINSNIDVLNIQAFKINDQSVQTGRGQPSPALSSQISNLKNL